MVHRRLHASHTVYFPSPSPTPPPHPSLPSLYAEVDEAEPDFEVKSIATNDPAFGNQWALTKIKAEEAWTTSTGATSISVCVIDTGERRAGEEGGGGKRGRVLEIGCMIWRA
jgi:hypothetical protein